MLIKYISFRRYFCLQCIRCNLSVCLWNLITQTLTNTKNKCRLHLVPTTLVPCTLPLCVLPCVFTSSMGTILTCSTGGKAKPKQPVNQSVSKSNHDKFSDHRTSFSQKLSQSDSYHLFVFFHCFFY